MSTLWFESGQGRYIRTLPETVPRPSPGQNLGRRLWMVRNPSDPFPSIYPGSTRERTSVRDMPRVQDTRSIYLKSW